MVHRLLKPSSISNSRSQTGTFRDKVPWAALFAVSLFLTIEMAIAWISSDPVLNADRVLEDRFYPPNRVPTVGESIVQWQIHNMLASQSKVDVLLFGDSSCLMGLQSKNLGSQTGAENVINMGLVGNLSNPALVKVLETFTERRGNPGIIVLQFSAGLFYALQDADTGKNFWPWFERISSEKEGYTHHWLPSLRLRRKAQSFLANVFVTEDDSPLLEKERGRFPSDNEIRRFLAENQGSMTDPGVPRTSLPVVTFSEPIREENVPPLRKLIQFADAHSKQVLIVFTPVMERHRTKGTDATYARYEQCILDILLECENTQLLTPALRYYPDELFASWSHLTYDGASRNTHEVAQWINRELAPE